MFKKVKNKKGFTLIELIVVIAILAVLAAIIIPTVANNIARANQARDLANTRSAYAAFVVELLVSETAPAAPTIPADTASGVCSVTYETGTTDVIATFSCVADTGTYSLDTDTGEIVNPND